MRERGVHMRHFRAIAQDLAALVLKRLDELGYVWEHFLFSFPFPIPRSTPHSTAKDPFIPSLLSPLGMSGVRPLPTNKSSTEDQILVY